MLCPDSCCSVDHVPVCIGRECRNSNPPTLCQIPKSHTTQCGVRKCESTCCGTRDAACSMCTVPCSTIYESQHSPHTPLNARSKERTIVPCDSLDMGRPIASGPVKCGCDEAGRKLLAATYASIQATCAVQNTTQAMRKVESTQHVACYSQVLEE